MAFGYGYPAYQPPMYQVPNPAPYQQQIGSMPTQYQQQVMPPVQQASQAQMSPQTNQSQPNVICRPVASEEEARATATPFDGSTLLLTDFGHGRVYSKALNYMDGSALFNTYQLVQPQAAQAVEIEASPVVEYAPRAELDSLRAELESLRAELEETKKATAAKKPTNKGGASE